MHTQTKTEELKIRPGVRLVLAGNAEYLKFLANKYGNMSILEVSRLENLEHQKEGKQ